jgi:hypothetical protein
MPQPPQPGSIDGECRQRGSGAVTRTVIHIDQLERTHRRAGSLDLGDDGLGGRG